MALCKNQCIKYDRGNKHRVYHENGSFCSVCDYYFKKWYLQCPCCKTRTRHVSRMSMPKNREILSQEI